MFMGAIVTIVHCAAGRKGALTSHQSPALPVGLSERQGFLLIISGFVKIQVGLRSMKTIAPLPERMDEGAEEDAPFKPLTAEEARRLREANPPVSPWWVVAGQAVVGLVVALAAWALTGKQNVGWSAGYGALAVVIPAAIFARGLTGRFSSLNAGTAAVGFMLWEMVKIASSIALMAAAPRLVADLSWPALLVGLVLTMKVYWVALAYAPKKRPTNAKL
jgi:ATP synthase protein I